MEDVGHKVTLNGRKTLTVTGATEVIRFDENAVVLGTTMGVMTVLGDGLQLKKLSLEGGVLAVDGEISALQYERPQENAGWLRRLLG